jgi:hypothetical protein
MAATPEDHAYIRRLLKHAEQVKAGLIPSDSPPDFVRPEGDAARDAKGLPWWFGPDYHPTAAAMKSFEEPVPGHPSSDTPISQTSENPEAPAA